jgi:chemotaxis protein histidine kinase CheA
LIVLSDDSRGFDEEALGSLSGTGPRQNAVEIAFLAGVSTHRERDELAGSGVGLGAVREELQKAGYLVTMDSTRGKALPRASSRARLDSE